MLPSIPNDYRIDEVKVTKTTVNNAPTYEITLVPFDCGYNFPKFQSVSGQVLQKLIQNFSLLPVWDFVVS